MANILFDIGIIIIIATMLSYVARLLKQPLLLAYVLAGVIIGPFGLGLIANSTDITLMAELGVAFLLFMVGLEIDFRKLKHVGKAVIAGGIFQILITFCIGFGLSALMGWDFVIGVYVGLLVAFSSTMLVTRLLIDKGELNTLQGRIMIGILIIQDLAVILVLPLLGNLGAVMSIELLSNIIIKGIGLFSIAVVLNRFIFPRVLDYAAKAREILFLTAISICFVFIGFSSVLGFSIVIGAFIAGLALGSFPYNLEIVGETHALMDFFSIIFFATLGMQFNLIAIQGMWPQFIILLAALLLIKPIILVLTYLVMGYGGRISSMVGIGLGQASEFSFILAAQGLALGHFAANPQIYTLIISAVLTSMVITLYLTKFRYKIYKFFLKGKNIPGFRRLGFAHQVAGLGKEPDKISRHVVIFGADIMGSRIVNYLIRKGAKFIVAEHNPEKVKSLSSVGVYSVYGEADNEELLRSVGLYRAKLAVITIPEPDVACFIIKRAKRRNKNIQIFARAYTKQEKELLMKAGADYVIVPELVSGDKLIEKISKVIK
jgi:CPA2 family monovalent cation:H+ antiporter-2